MCDSLSCHHVLKGQKARSQITLHLLQWNYPFGRECGSRLLLVNLCWKNPEAMGCNCREKARTKRSMPFNASGLHVKHQGVHSYSQATRRTHELCRSSFNDCNHQDLVPVRVGWIEGRTWTWTCDQRWSLNQANVVDVSDVLSICCYQVTALVRVMPAQSFVQCLIMRFSSFLLPATSLPHHEWHVLHRRWASTHVVNIHSAMQTAFRVVQKHRLFSISAR